MRRRRRPRVRTRTTSCARARRPPSSGPPSSPAPRSLPLPRRRTTGARGVRGSATRSTTFSISPALPPPIASPSPTSSLRGPFSRPMRKLFSRPTHNPPPSPPFPTASQSTSAPFPPPPSPSAVLSIRPKKRQAGRGQKPPKGRGQKPPKGRDQKQSDQTQPAFITFPTTMVRRRWMCRIPLYPPTLPFAPLAFCTPRSLERAARPTRSATLKGPGTTSSARSPSHTCSSASSSLPPTGKTSLACSSPSTTRPPRPRAPSSS